MIGLLAGCDLAGSEADLDLLVGSWRIDALFVDEVSMKAQLEAQYSLLVLTLRESAGGHEFFSLVGREDGRGRTLLVQGSFRVDSGDDELTLFPNDGSLVEFDYVVPDSSRRRLLLRAEEGTSEDRFLELIQFPIQGRVDHLAIRLSDSNSSTWGTDVPGSYLRSLQSDHTSISHTTAITRHPARRTPSVGHVQWSLR